MITSADVNNIDELVTVAPVSVGNMGCQHFSEAEKNHKAMDDNYIVLISFVYLV